MSWKKSRSIFDDDDDDEDGSASVDQPRFGSSVPRHSPALAAMAASRQSSTAAATPASASSGSTAAVTAPAASSHDSGVDSLALLQQESVDLADLNLDSYDRERANTLTGNATEADPF
jgi:hypothetical protein